MHAHSFRSMSVTPKALTSLLTILVSTARGLRCLFAGTNRILCTENEMGGESCSICLADFEAGEDLVILPCEHRFCPNGCIENWLRISSKCPNCKQDSKVCGEPMLRRGKWRDVDTGETKQ